MKQVLQSMLDLGVIEESFSNWKSPVMLFPKPDRFCIDFQMVNAVSKIYVYLMPHIDELLDHLGEVEYITTLDLNKGYWQIALTPESREKTAFSTPCGLFQTMPFNV